MAVETTPVFSHYSTSLMVLLCSHLASVYPTGYSSEGQVKLEVLYSVQDTTVVLHRDWITYSKDAPRSLPQQSDMGASHSAAGETASPQDSPQDDHTLRRGDTLVTELLKECVQTEWVGSPSCAMVEALSASLQPLSSDNLARVDCEVAISLEQGSLPRRVDTDHRREESPPTGGWGLTGSPTAPHGGMGWVGGDEVESHLLCVRFCRDDTSACSGRVRDGVCCTVLGSTSWSKSSCNSIGPEWSDARGGC